MVHAVNSREHRLGILPSGDHEPGREKLRVVSPDEPKLGGFIEMSGLNGLVEAGVDVEV